ADRSFAEGGNGMNSKEVPTRARIEAYLARLRSALGRIPPQEADDNLREIHGHIVERAEAARGAEADAIERILEEMGRPEDIGSLYRTEALVARAQATFSPFLIVRATVRWATKTALGFIALMLGIIGYGLGLALIGCAVLKPFFPNYIGLWVNQHGAQLATYRFPGQGPDLLGWWVIPIYLVLGAIAVVGTTLSLRWMLRFASQSSRRATVPAWLAGTRFRS
ncbi:MAG: HAAS signaling domain-containing protein, partial [Steroidobacteraceae bacterium]